MSAPTGAHEGRRPRGLPWSAPVPSKAASAAGSLPCLAKDCSQGRREHSWFCPDHQYMAHAGSSAPPAPRRYNHADFIPTYGPGSFKNRPGAWLPPTRLEDSAPIERAATLCMAILYAGVIVVAIVLILQGAHPL